MFTKNIKLALVICFGINVLLPQAAMGIMHPVESMLGTMPKRSVAHYQDEQAFESKVRKYVEGICSKQKPEVQKILNAIGTVHKRIEYDELKQMLDDVVQARAHVQGDTNNTQAHEELRCALLLKVSVPLAEFVRKAMLHTLNDLGKQIKYWEHQQAHPISYFFHKSPHKWLTQRKQSQEILGNLHQLRHVQTEHFKMLGILKIHLNSFDNNAAVPDQYTWLAQLLSIAQQLCTGKDLNIQEIMSYDKLLPLMHRLLDKVENHQDRITDHVIAGAFKPNHLVRNWWKYSAAGASAFAAWYYGYHNQENRDKITNVATHFGKSFYEQVVSGPLQGARDVFLEKAEKSGDSKKPKDIFENIKGRVGAFVDELDQLKAKITKKDNGGKQEIPDGEGEGEPTIGAALEELGDVLGDLKQGFGRIYEEVKKNDGRPAEKDQGWASWVGNKADKMAQDKLEKFFPKRKRDAIIRELDGCIEPKIRELEPKVRELVGLIQERGASLVADSSELSGKAAQILDGVKEGVDSVKRLLDDAHTLSDDVGGIVNQQKATFAFLRLVPLGVIACGAGALLYKAYKTLRGKPNYEPIRTTLVDIAHLLNWYDDVPPSEMQPEDYGKLLYLGYRLKKEKRLVPEEKRSRFVHDVNKLSSAWLTADRKMKVVDLMYKTYDFLTPTYIG